MCVCTYVDGDMELPEGYDWANNYIPPSLCNMRVCMSTDFRFYFRNIYTYIHIYIHDTYMHMHIHESS